MKMKDLTDRERPLNHHLDPERYVTEFAVDTNEPCLALVNAIATIEGIDPIEVDPLDIDMDALNRLLQSSNGGCEIQIALPTHGYHVVIRSEGSLQLFPTERKS